MFNMIITEIEQKTLKTLIFHGGFFTMKMYSEFMGFSVQRAHKIFSGLVDGGYIKPVLILSLRGAGKYYQITKKSAVLLGHQNANCARTNPSDFYAMRGLSRFWFRVNYKLETVEQFLDDQDEIKRAFALFKIDLPALDGKSETYHKGASYYDTFILNAELKKIKIYSFPPLGKSLENSVKNTILRYADELDKILIGFVIDSQRKAELLKIVETLGGLQFQTDDEAENNTEIEQTLPPEILAKLAELEAKKETVGNIQKLMIDDEIEELKNSASPNPTGTQKPADQGELASVLLPIIEHKAF